MLSAKQGMRVDLIDAHGKKRTASNTKTKRPGRPGQMALRSLERICPTADGTLPENWAASPLLEELKPGGTPGQKNSSYSATLPPIISAVKFSPANPTPEQSVRVEAEIRGANIREVQLRYRLVTSGTEGSEVSLAMSKSGERQFIATIPAQKANQLVRFRVQAVNSQGAQRFFPSENGPHHALSCFVHEKLDHGKIPSALIINVDAEEQKGLDKHLHQANERGFSEEDQMRMFAGNRIRARLGAALVRVGSQTANECGAITAGADHFERSTLRP